MEVIRETLWKRSLSTPTKPPAKNSNICLSEAAYRHKGTRDKCKKTNQGAIIQWQRQWLMDKAHRKPSPKSKTSDVSKQSPSPLHHTFLLGSARFTAQPLSALRVTVRPHHRHTSVKKLNQQVCQPKCDSKFYLEEKTITKSCLFRRYFLCLH